MTLDYSFSSELIQKLPIVSLWLYVNVSNPFPITSYKGMDSEVGSWNSLQAGIDNGFYPQFRTFTFGINAGLTKEKNEKK